MGNIVNTLKKFISNKNTVTILGVLLGIVVLYVGYNYRVSHAIDTIEIPYATTTLSATTEITKDNVSTMEVLKSMVTNNSNIISDMSSVVNTSTPYCVSEGTSIASGSFFYTDQVKLCSTVSNNVLKNMPDGYKPVSISVDLHSTYGNSMYPGDYIDLYIQTYTDDGKLVYGLFISKLPILDVRDSSGNSVFASGSSSTPSELLFAVPNCDSDGTNLYLLLSKVILLSSQFTIIPVPGNATYTTEVGETKVESEYIKERILYYTSTIPDEDTDTCTATS